MKGDQMGIRAAYPTQRELPLSNWTWFRLVLCSTFEALFDDYEGMGSCDVPRFGSAGIAAAFQERFR
jgi:hypothetical protein